MTTARRQSLVDLMASILACKCCPPDIRVRAETLLEKLRADDFADFIRRFTHGRRA